MRTKEAVAKRIRNSCIERKITSNALSRISYVPQATIKSILNDESKNPGVVTIKKICDGFGISLADFFAANEFDRLEQEFEQKKDIHEGVSPIIDVLLV